MSKYTRIWIIPMAVLFAVILSSLMSVASGERKGEDSSPPANGEGDWYIDSTGNYIGNETEWTEIIDDGGDEPTVIEHDDGVKIECNIRIVNGGELLLFNTTINFTDHEKSTIIIEEGGRLIMENVSILKNGNGSFMGTPEINGDLIMRNCSIQNVESIMIKTSKNTLELENSYFTMNGTFTLANCEISLNWLSFTSFSSTALYVDNCSLELTGGYISTISNDSVQTILFIKDSEFTGNMISVTSFSPVNEVVRIIGSNVTLQDGSMIESSNSDMAIYAIDSRIDLIGLKKMRSKSGSLMECYDCDIQIYNGSLGYHGKFQSSFSGGLVLEDSRLEFKNINFYRFSSEVIVGKNVELFLQATNFWNISEQAISLNGGTITIENAGFYNVSGDAIHLNNVIGEIVNCTIDEDDPWWHDNSPFPAVYAGYGNGIGGHGIIAMDSQLSISGMNISRTEKDFIHLRDCRVDIQNCNLKAAGTEETSMIHGICMENSNGIIRDNNFSSAHRGGGFNLYGMGGIPMNLTEFVESNTFGDGRIFQQHFSLGLRVVDQYGTPVQGVMINLTDCDSRIRYLSETGVDGWIPDPLVVRVFEIFRTEGRNEENNQTWETFMNTSYNHHDLLLEKEYQEHNFTLTNEIEIHVGRSMIIDVNLDVSTPELHVVTAGIIPRVLEGGELEVLTVSCNMGERFVNDVMIGFYSSLIGENDWSFIGSGIIDIPGLMEGGNHCDLTFVFPIGVSLGMYDLLIIVDPEEQIAERDEQNNQYIITHAFEVLSKPRIFIDLPLDQETVSGMYTISGYAQDDYDNDIDAIELYIDGSRFQVTEIIQKEDRVLWSYDWDTTPYDAAQGSDVYPNGPHVLSVWCRNSNPTGFSRSACFNVTAVVVNIPVLHLRDPQQDDYINLTSGLPLYEVVVNVIEFHDLGSIQLQVDKRPFSFMTRKASSYRAMIDTTKLSDGYHSLSYYATYEYGNLSETVSVLVNSPSESSKPSISLSYELTDEGFSLWGSSWDDLAIRMIQVRLDEGNWITVNESRDENSTFEYFWERGKLSPDAHSITVRSFDDTDFIEETRWFDVGLLYDLRIASIIMPLKGTDGDWLNLTVIVENLRPYDSPEVKLVVQIGEIMRTINGLVIPGNSTSSIRVSWHAEEGNHTLSAEINPSQKNYETDPGNNAFTGDILSVKERPQLQEDEDSGSHSLTIAVGVMSILGLAAIAGYFMNGRKKRGW